MSSSGDQNNNRDNGNNNNSNNHGNGGNKRARSSPPAAAPSAGSSRASRNHNPSRRTSRQQNNDANNNADIVISPAVFNMLQTHAAASLAQAQATFIQAQRLVGTLERNGLSTPRGTATPTATPRRRRTSQPTQPNPLNGTWNSPPPQQQKQQQQGAWTHNTGTHLFGAHTNGTAHGSTHNMGANGTHFFGTHTGNGTPHNMGANGTHSFGTHTGNGTPFQQAPQNGATSNGGFAFGSATSTQQQAPPPSSRFSFAAVPGAPPPAQQQGFGAAQRAPPPQQQQGFTFGAAQQAPPQQQQQPAPPQQTPNANHLVDSTLERVAVDSIFSRSSRHLRKQAPPQRAPPQQAPPQVLGRVAADSISSRLTEAPWWLGPDELWVRRQHQLSLSLLTLCLTAVGCLGCFAYSVLGEDMELYFCCTDQKLLLETTNESSPSRFDEQHSDCGENGISHG